MVSEKAYDEQSWRTLSSGARAVLPAAALSALVACSGSGGAGSSFTPVAPQPVPWRLSGTLVDTTSGEPLAGASLQFTTLGTVTTDSGGRWEVQGSGFVLNPGVTIASDGLVTRETTVRWDSAGRNDVRLDAITERPPFRLEYFRQFARNGMEDPDNLRPIRRWLQTPNFYVRIVNPRTGERLTDREVSLIEESLRASVPQLTAGMFEAAEVEMGTEERAPAAGVIRGVFVDEPEGTFCARAFVGVNPGEITINYDRCRTSCGAFAPETLAHEVGHAMGFWHTSGQGLMSTERSRQCGNLQFSADERHHARVAYARPNGNTDPDRDPSTFAAVETGEREQVTCRR